MVAVSRLSTVHGPWSTADRELKKSAGILAGALGRAREKHNKQAPNPNGSPQSAAVAHCKGLVFHSELGIGKE